MMQRFVKGFLIFGTLLTTLGLGPVSADALGPQTIRKDQISVQLYSARKYSDSKEHIDYLLGELARIGYPNVEMAGFWNLSGSEWKSLLAKHHLGVSSVHTNEFELANGVQPVIDNMKQLGATQLVFAYTPTDFSNPEATAKFIALLNGYKATFAQAGIDLIYHNHNMEFVKAADGTTAFGQILGKTGLPAELDIHWASRGGVSVPSLIDQMGTQLRYIHLKDLGLGKLAKADDIPVFRPVLFEELGQGNLDLKAIVASAKAAGCRWYVVEQDNDFADGEPLKSLEASYNYLVDTFCQVPDRSRISVQLYSARKYSDTKEHIDFLLGELARIGYRNVELAGFWNLSGAEWKDLLKNHGLTVSSVHTNQFELAEGTKKVIDNMKQVGCTQLVYAYTTTNFDDPKATDAFVAQLNAYKATFAKAGIELIYHNHNMEFVKAPDGSTVYSRILAKTGLAAELDVHWASRAGMSVPALEAQVGKQLKYVHMKDVGVGALAKADDVNVFRPVLFEELGQGNLDLAAIVAAAKAAGAQWYVVEQDNDFADGEPLKSLEASFFYLSRNLTK